MIHSLNTNKIIKDSAEKSNLFFTVSLLLLKTAKTGLIILLNFTNFSYILHSIFNYKIVEEGKNDKLGFPSTIIDKIIEKLEELAINYQIYYKKELEISKDFQENNTYQKYLNEGLLQVEIDKKVDLIKYKLNRLSLEEVNKQLENILDILR